MKRKKDFYRYNIILGIILFISVLSAVDLNPNSQKSLPDFSPKRFTASIQKARQTLAIELESTHLQQENSFEIHSEIETLQPDLTILNYTWYLGENQILLNGNTAGTIDLTKNRSLQISIHAPLYGKVKLELIGESNGIRIGGSKTIQLSPENFNNTVHEEKISSDKKTKTEILQDIYKRRQKINIQQ